TVARSSLFLQDHPTRERLSLPPQVDVDRGAGAVAGQKIVEYVKVSNRLPADRRDHITRLESGRLGRPSVLDQDDERPPFHRPAECADHAHGDGGLPSIQSGLPIATAVWPTANRPESPSGTDGRFLPSILTTARSVKRSAPIRTARNTRPSVNVSLISSAPS